MQDSVNYIQSSFVVSPAIVVDFAVYLHMYVLIKIISLVFNHINNNNNSSSNNNKASTILYVHICACVCACVCGCGCASRYVH